MVNDTRKNEGLKQNTDENCMRSKSLEIWSEINQLSFENEYIGSHLKYRTRTNKYDEEFQINKDFKANSECNSQGFEPNANFKIRRDVMNKNFIRAIKRELTKIFIKFLHIKNLK